jgi:hypothetical protein
MRENLCPMRENSPNLVTLLHSVAMRRWGFTTLPSLDKPFSYKCPYHLDFIRVHTFTTCTYALKWFLKHACFSGVTLFFADSFLLHSFQNVPFTWILSFFKLSNAENCDECAVGFIRWSNRTTFLSNWGYQMSIECTVHAAQAFPCMYVNVSMYM